jgi:outer membrane protein OmpA-like peptidoglycan-associated protein
MKRQCLTLAVTAGLLASASLITTACASPRACPTGPVTPGLAVAVGNRTGSPRPSWPVQLDSRLARVIKVTEQETADHQPVMTGVTFVRVDGNPAVGCVMTYDANAANGTAQNDASHGFMDQVHQEVAKIEAGYPQADPLTSLSRAGAAAGPGGTVVLIDSGVQTVPPLDFAKDDLLDADITTVVSRLRAAGELPHLRGQTVFLDGIGYTAAPQAPLDESQRDHLVGLWQQIAYAGGAAHVQVITTPDTDAAQGGLLPVSSVPVPPPDDVALGCNRQSVLPDDGAVGFMPGSTTFRQPGEANTVLARIAGWLRHHPSADASLTGSIAHYGRDSGNGLSGARAGKIRSVLIQLGASPGQVTAAGVGWGPFPAKTAPPDPVSDSLNRRVVVRISCG